MDVRSMDFRTAWQELKAFERDNNLSSEQFYQLYRGGLIEPNITAMRWATVCEIFNELAPSASSDRLDRRLVSA